MNKQLNIVCKVANQGNAKAQCYLGDTYYYGKGVIRDYVQAVKWYRKAANHGHADAQYNLGLAFHEGEGVEQNYEEAAKWWHKAAKQGHIDAQYDLGIAYQEGEGVEQNYEEAAKWWHKAAKQGHIDAQYDLGIAYYDAKVIKEGEFVQDYAQAIDLWRKAAFHGHVEAQFRLGLTYHEGQDVAKDSKTAFFWWTKAANQGKSEAQYCIGNAYYEGHGVSRNNKEAVNWWHKAANKGQITAQYKLGVAYNKGIGVNKDHEEALKWFHKVDKHEEKKNPIRIPAQYFLGIMYKNGEGTSPDIKKAESWLRKVFTDIKGKVKQDSIDFLDVDLQKALIMSVRILAQETLEDIVKLKEQEKAKQELEDVMAMFAHKFRGPLQSIQYNLEHENQKKVTLQAVQTMAGLLNIFSTIATKPQQLRNKLQQDMQGHGTIISALEKALLPVMTQVLTINNTKKIRQHYLQYAKKNGQVPTTTTRKQWVEDYDLEEQLQTKWEESFSELLAEPRLDQIVFWLKARFFSLEMSGFNDDSIHFEHYGATESVLIIVMTEILLNTFKYYSSETNEPVKLHWQHDKDFCRIVCENPSHRNEQRIDKGSKKGHSFLSIIAHNLAGEFPDPLPKNPYRVEWYVPTDLFVKENV